MYKSAKNAGKLILFINIALQWMAMIFSLIISLK